MPEPVSPTEHAAKANPAVTHPSSEDLADLGARLFSAERQRDKLQQALAAADARERELANELQHRVRNMLGVIRSIYRRSQESGASQDEFAAHFEGRMDVIARYQSDLVELRQGGVELEDIVRDELLLVHCVDEAGLSVTGPSIRLRQKALELVALTIHELVTNSLKFGALYHNGKLDIGWTISGWAPNRMLHVRWSETSIPLVTAAPRPRGFGRQLVEEALPYQLGAKTSFEFKPGSFECSIALPLTPPGVIELADRGAADDDDAPFLSSDPECPR